MIPEQITAKILRKLYKLGVINFETLDRLINELQLKLFERELGNKNE